MSLPLAVICKTFPIATYLKSPVPTKQNVQRFFYNSTTIALAAIILKWDPYTFYAAIFWKLLWVHYLFSPDMAFKIKYHMIEEQLAFST